MIAKGTPRARIYAALMKDALPVRPPAKPRRRTTTTSPAPRPTPRSIRSSRATRRRRGRRTRRWCWWSSPTSSAPSASGSNRRWPRWRSTTPGRCAWSGRTIRSPSTTTQSRPPRRRWPPTRRGSSGRCTTGCSTNNTALDRESLENYAAAIGLDLPRFRADLDAGRYKARIEADKQEGSDARRRRDARRLHQRPQDRRRLPVRDLPEDRRRGARQGDGKADGKHAPPKRKKPPVSQNGRLRSNRAPGGARLVRAT